MKMKMFQIKNYYAPIYNFGFYVYDIEHLFIIGGDNLTDDDYDLKGYIINLKEEKLISQFDLKNIFVNKEGMPKYFRGSMFVTNMTLFIGSIVMMFVTNWIMAITAILSTIEEI